MNRNVILFNKPYGVVSQFTPAGAWETLAEYGPFPRTVYAAGRLDAESEGLLILTDDNFIRERLTEPRYRHPRTYLAQVERIPDPPVLEKLERGMVIDGKRTLPATVLLLEREPDIPPRPVPIRFRKNVPTAWLEMTLTEGRNRQVRKMTAHAGFPLLRLVRIRIGRLTLEGLAPGDSRSMSPPEIETLKEELALLPGLTGEVYSNPSRRRQEER